MQRRGIRVIKCTESVGPSRRELVRAGELCVEVRVNPKSLNSEGDLVSEHNKWTGRGSSTSTGEVESEGIAVVSERDS